jgi:hypothetical protein
VAIRESALDDVVWRFYEGDAPLRADDENERRQVGSSRRGQRHGRERGGPVSLAIGAVTTMLSTP